MWGFILLALSRQQVVGLDAEGWDGRPSGMGSGPEKAFLEKCIRAESAFRDGVIALPGTVWGQASSREVPP